MNKITDVVPGAVLELLRSTPLSPGKAAFAWKVAVGPALERATDVALEGRTLVVTVPSRQWAREVQRSSSMLISRLARYLGPGVVTGLDVRVGSLEPRPPHREL
jgi:predicted nucleic acid-binding Zn ribbon protein